LAAIDQTTEDIEERADLMGAMLLTPVMGERTCQQAARPNSVLTGTLLFTLCM
jgi:hypothetical protein